MFTVYMGFSQFLQKTDADFDEKFQSKQFEI